MGEDVPRGTKPWIRNGNSSAGSARRVTLARKHPDRAADRSLGQVQGERSGNSGSDHHTVRLTALLRGIATWRKLLRASIPEENRQPIVQKPDPTRHSPPIWRCGACSEKVSTIQFLWPTPEFDQDETLPHHPHLGIQQIPGSKADPRSGIPERRPALDLAGVQGLLEDLVRLGRVASGGYRSQEPPQFSWI